MADSNILKQRPPECPPELSRGAAFYASIDGGDRRAVLLSPVLPTWDAGAYFYLLVAPLRAAGYSITIYDTLAFAEQGASFDDIVSGWRRHLEFIGRPDLLGGAALGGTVAQALLSASTFADIERVLLISAPSRVDRELSGKLAELIMLAQDAGVQACLARLDYFVCREGAETGLPPTQALVEPNLHAASRRLSIGFSALLDVDVTRAVMAHRGRVLHIVGSDSRLVTERHIAPDDGERHRRALIPEAGMRPLSDRPEMVLREVENFLR